MKYIRIWFCLIIVICCLYIAGMYIDTVPYGFITYAKSSIVRVRLFNWFIIPLLLNFSLPTTHYDDKFSNLLKNELSDVTAILLGRMVLIIPASIFSILQFKNPITDEWQGLRADVLSAPSLYTVYWLIAGVVSLIIPAIWMCKRYNLPLFRSLLAVFISGCVLQVTYGNVNTAFVWFWIVLCGGLNIVILGTPDRKPL